MELKVFIKQTLTDLTQAISEVNSELNKGEHEPHFRLMKGYEGYLKDLQTKNPGFIDFDMAVTSSGSVKGEAKAGISIQVVELGGKLKSTDLTENISRIRFSIGVNKEIT